MLGLWSVVSASGPATYYILRGKPYFDYLLVLDRQKKMHCLPCMGIQMLVTKLKPWCKANSWVLVFGFLGRGASKIED